MKTREFHVRFPKKVVVFLRGLFCLIRMEYAWREGGSRTPKFLPIILLGTATWNLSVKQQDQSLQTPLRSIVNSISSNLVLLDQGVQVRPANLQSLQAVCVHMHVCVKHVQTRRAREAVGYCTLVCLSLKTTDFKAVLVWVGYDYSLLWSPNIGKPQT